MEYSARKAGTIIDSLFLKISPAVLLLDGVLMTCAVANRSDVSTMSPSEALDNIDLEVIYRNTVWTNPNVKERRKVAKKCEVLVPDLVPPNYILNMPNG
jgi:hypothetical protein